MKAMQWIREDSPADSVLMVNTAAFSFRPRFIVGIDAGYWIPLLARRGTVSLPMVYGSERTSDPSALDNLVSLHLAGGDLTTPDALSALMKAGVTHVYIGDRGGPISIDQLIACGLYAVVYNESRVTILRLVNQAQ